VAKAYHAACTPDFFLFDVRASWSTAASSTTADRHGRPVTGRDLPPGDRRRCSGQAGRCGAEAELGCNIKWKVGNAPAWFA